MAEVGAEAATDVTGFGLLGHLWRCWRPPGWRAEVRRRRAARSSTARRELARQGAIAGGTKRNHAWLADRVDWGGLEQAGQYLLADAQTSGGPADRHDGPRSPRGGAPQPGCRPDRRRPDHRGEPRARAGPGHDRGEVLPRPIRPEAARPVKPARSALALAVLACVLTPGSAAWAADGDLDPTWSGDGRVTTSWSGLDQIHDVAFESGGSVIAVGSVAVGFDFHAGLTRYRPDGSVDASFGEDGLVATNLGENGAIAHGVAIQHDGKIVVAVSDDVQRLTVARFNRDGSPDPTFGGDGEASAFSSSLEDTWDVAIQSDGKILGVGSASGFSGTLAQQHRRSLPAGRLARHGVRQPGHGALRERCALGRALADAGRRSHPGRRSWPSAGGAHAATLGAPPDRLGSLNDASFAVRGHRRGAGGEARTTVAVQPDGPAWSRPASAGAALALVPIHLGGRRRRDVRLRAVTVTASFGGAAGPRQRRSGMLNDGRVVGGGHQRAPRGAGATDERLDDGIVARYTAAGTLGRGLRDVGGSFGARSVPDDEAVQALALLPTGPHPGGRRDVHRDRDRAAWRVRAGPLCSGPAGDRPIPGQVPGGRTSRARSSGTASARRAARAPRDATSSAGSAGPTSSTARRGNGPGVRWGRTTTWCSARAATDGLARGPRMRTSSRRRRGRPPLQANAGEDTLLGTDNVGGNDTPRRRDRDGTRCKADTGRPPDRLPLTLG